MRTSGGRGWWSLGWATGRRGGRGKEVGLESRGEARVSTASPWGSLRLKCCPASLISWRADERQTGLNGSTKAGGAVGPGVVDYEDYEFGNECAYTKKENLH
ncbi:hypothetical protein Tco_1154583 [Tanacetum coccineum]